MGKIIRKPRIFIASSIESMDVADAFNVNLDHQAEVTVWKNGFQLSQTSIDSLVKISGTFDFAVFIFTPDDITKIRNQEKNTVRDNVLFELGLFTGTLGKERCFIVRPRDVDMHLPTDLLGLTPVDYDGNRSDGNLEAAVNHPSTLIKKEVLKLGLISEDIGIQKKNRRKIDHTYKVGYYEFKLLSKILEGYSRSPEGVSVWSVFNDLNDIDAGTLSLSMVKLERMGYLDKSVSYEQHGDAYYILIVTADGIDYLIENEGEYTGDMPF